MINVTIRYDNNERKIDFLCSGKVLDAKLQELGVRDMTEAKMIVFLPKFLKKIFPHTLMRFKFLKRKGFEKSFS